MSSEKNAFLELAVDLYFQRISSVFVYSLIYSYSLATLVQFARILSGASFFSILFSFTTLKLTVGILSIFLLNILLINSYSHVKLLETEKRLWPLIELIKQRNKLFVCSLAFFFSGYICLSSVSLLSLKNSNSFWIYPEG
ncbi:hypothetical protein AYI70_g2556 [Smittium culicis]|uniref:Uncharacterized protein n=1 Tax=Smittium culicis TaxID=133412 RepID=A0A1R1Y7W7_9FUNG|nr:hypothetical protein AYI70_g2556 [Smittium culicis]